MDGKRKRSAKAAKKTKKATKERTEEAKRFLVAFGERLKQLREEQELSQVQLAFECDMSRVTINRIERGKYETGIASILRLARALNVSVGDLLDFEI